MSTAQTWLTCLSVEGESVHREEVCFFHAGTGLSNLAPPARLCGPPPTMARRLAGIDDDDDDDDDDDELCSMRFIVALSALVVGNGKAFASTSPG